MKDGRNLTLLMDLYELTMAQVYFDQGTDETVVFEMFYRRNPEGAGFCIFAGLEQVIEYIQDFHFSESDLDYLRSLNRFSEPFLEYLKTVRFTGDLWSVPEGTPVFPYEPLIRVKAPLIQAQLIETALLLAVNHQTLIATKARRIVQAADGRAVMEFGARRAHSFDAALYGSRACYIAGATGSATTLSGKLFDMPVLGTMAHSFVQSFPDEYEAFKAYATTYPDSCTLLIDTYNTLDSGLENAIRVAKDVLEPQGKKLQGVRIDSGDMAYLSKKIRRRLDEEGMQDTQIVVSNSLDEYLIESLKNQGAKIDLFGVGENMIVSKSNPVFGGVYKLVAVEEDGKMIPKIKISENTEKITNPGYKNLYRIYDRETGKAMGDLMTFADEIIDEKEDLTIYHPMNPWKNKTFEKETFIIRELLIPVFIDGKLVYDFPDLKEIRKYCEKEQETLWDELKRFANPSEYYVDLSRTLLDKKLSMLEELR